MYLVSILLCERSGKSSNLFYLTNLFLTFCYVNSYLLIGRVNITSMKTSKIWKLEKNKFQELIDNSSSFRDVLRKIGLTIVAGNYVTLNNRIKNENISLSKLIFNRKQLRKTWKPNKKIYSNEKVFVENSNCGRGNIKKRIMNDDLLPYECSKCKSKNEWMGEPLILVLDHINGVNNDCRLNNLRFLCPNCNSQTSTFSGRNNKQKLKICPSCKTQYAGYGRICRKCWRDNQPQKFNITKEELKQRVINNKQSFRSIGKMYHVSGNSIKKRCKRFGII